MNSKEIAMRVRQLREQRQLTQEEVAELLGIKQPAYCDRESGATTFKAVELDKLATFYGVSLDELLRGGQPVLHMHDHSSYGYIHHQIQNGAGEALFKRLVDLLEANTVALRDLVAQQAKVIELLSRGGK